MSTEPAPLGPGGNSEDSTRTIRMSDAAPGAATGPYQLIRQIGEGGMGVVYHAQQLRPIRRDVALKIIKLPSKTTLKRCEFASPGRP